MAQLVTTTPSTTGEASLIHRTSKGLLTSTWVGRKLKSRTTSEHPSPMLTPTASFHSRWVEDRNQRGGGCMDDKVAKLPRCQALKSDGTSCERIVGASQKYCYRHDKSRAAERKANASRVLRARLAS